MVSEPMRQLIQARSAVQKRLREGWEVLIRPKDKQVWARVDDNDKVHFDEITPPEGIVLDLILNEDQTNQ